MFARRLIFILAVGPFLPILAQKANWESLRPGVSTQADAIYLFGTPERVELQMEWPEFLKFQSKPRSSSAYLLKYSPSPSRPELVILNGPFGRASSASIYVEAGKVQSLEWEYCCVYREPASRLWFSDDKFQLKRAGKILIGQKSVKNGLLSATCSSLSDKPVCDGDVSVLYMTRE